MNHPKLRQAFVIATLLAVALLAASRTCHAGLSAYWKFDEGAGATATDSVGGNVGTLQNGAVFSGDVPAVTGGGSSIIFDGTNDYIGVPDSPSVSPTGNITLSAWFKSPSFAGTARNILAKDSNNAYRWRMQDDGELWALLNDGGGLELHFSTVNAPTGGWHHTAVTADFADKKVRFYLDGNLMATQSTAKTGLADTAGSLVIGAYNGGGSESFNGNLDEVAIWDHRLSHSQIAALAGGTMATGVGITLLNPSFEDDTFATWPGYITQAGNGPISGWTNNGGGGINPTSGGSPFADNGTIPDGSQVAFIQGAGNSLSQTVYGFEPGENYIVTYRENARNGNNPRAEVTVGGQTVVGDHPLTSVGGANPYRYVGSSVFTPSVPDNDLVFTNTVTGGDNTLLIDDVGIHPVYLLFGDNFNALSNNYDINPIPANDEPGRRSGMFGSAAYVERGGTPANFTQVDNPDYPDALLLAPDAGFGTVTVSPDVDFSLPATSPTHFVVDVDVDPIHPTNGYQGEQGDWAAVVIGSSSQTASVNTSDGIGVLIRGNGGYQIFDGSDGVNDVEASGDLGDDFGIDENGFYNLRLNYFVPNFDDVTPGLVAVSVDGMLIHSFTTDSGFARNFVNLVGYGPRAGNTLHGFDNFQVWATAVPEPSALALLVLGIAVLAAARRRKRLLPGDR